MGISIWTYSAVDCPRQVVLRRGPTSGSVDAEFAFPLPIGNTRRLPSPSVRAARCSRFAFIRIAEMVHTRSVVSISVHVARSYFRRARSRQNEKLDASLTAGCADLDDRIVSIAVATSLCGSASRCVTMSFYGPSTGSTRSHGLSLRRSMDRHENLATICRCNGLRGVVSLRFPYGSPQSQPDSVALPGPAVDQPERAGVRDGRLLGQTFKQSARTPARRLRIRRA